MSINIFNSLNKENELDRAFYLLYFPGQIKQGLLPVAEKSYVRVDDFISSSS